ncbi:unnamed protein product [Orchesella dallaii]|uniref:Uncharacterized protein n=2 Tax=Orchesella dallaii TaxID=48710 RepID=A0ABP1S857_9HEXA
MWDFEIMLKILKTGSCHTYNVTNLSTSSRVRKFCSTLITPTYSLPTIPPRVNRVRGTDNYNGRIVIWVLLGMVIGACCKFYSSCKNAQDNQEIQLEQNVHPETSNTLGFPTLLSSVRDPLISGLYFACTSPIPPLSPSPSGSPPKYYDLQLEGPPPEYPAPPTYSESVSYV